MSARLEERFAARLREVCEQRGLPVTHLADLAGVSRSHVWRLLSGEQSATLALVQRLAAALGVDPLELLRAPDRASREGRQPRRGR